MSGGVALAAGSKVAMDEEEAATAGGFGQFYKVRKSIFERDGRRDLSFVAPADDGDGLVGPARGWRAAMWSENIDAGGGGVG